MNQGTIRDQGTKDPGNYKELRDQVTKEPRNYKGLREQGTKKGGIKELKTKESRN